MSELEFHSLARSLDEGGGREEAASGEYRIADTVEAVEAVIGGRRALRWLMFALDVETLPSIRCARPGGPVDRRGAGRSVVSAVRAPAVHGHAGAPRGGQPAPAHRSGAWRPSSRSWAMGQWPRSATTSSTTAGAAPGRRDAAGCHLRHHDRELHDRSASVRTDWTPSALSSSTPGSAASRSSSERGAPEKSFAEVAVREAADYCCADSDYTLRLRHRFAPDPRRPQPRAACSTTWKSPLIGVLVDMEWEGIAIDLSGAFSRLSAQMRSELAAHRARRIHVGHAATVQYSLQRRPIDRHCCSRRPPRRCSRRAESDRSLDRAEVLEEDRGLTRRGTPRSAVAAGVPRDLEAPDDLPGGAAERGEPGHWPDTHLVQTRSGGHRPAELDQPNLQNIPGALTPRRSDPRGFVPSSGEPLIRRRHSQIELRLPGHLSRDQAFVDAFLAGGDIPPADGAVIFRVAPDAVTRAARRRAKTINSHQVYGQATHALARQLGNSGTTTHGASSRTYLRPIRNGVRRLPRPHGSGRPRSADTSRPSSGAGGTSRELRDKNTASVPSGSAPRPIPRCRGSAADLIKVA